MHGLALIYVVRDLPGIEAFKIVQESRELTRVLRRAGPGFDRGGLSARFATGMQARLGRRTSTSTSMIVDDDRRPSSRENTATS